MNKQKIAIALSGGIDSAAVALILKNRGFDCFGVSMQLFKPNKLQYNKINDDILLASKIADKLCMTHYIIDVSSEFEEIVVNDFANEYSNARTPNPCVVCNQKIKLGLLLNKAIQMGADIMATGHYARVRYNSNIDKYELLRGAADNKDQAYPLHRLSQYQLSRLMFPLGEFESKEDIYKLISNSELSSLFEGQKRESMGVCFASAKGYADTIKQIVPQAFKEGAIVNVKGQIIGRHKGIAYYTIGQKKGININNLKKNNDKNVVVSIDAKKNQIMVGDESKLYKNRIYLNDFNKVDGCLNDIVGKSLVWKHCHWGNPFSGDIAMDDNKIYIDCDLPQRAPANGQYAVAYDGDKIIGGGRIVYSE